LSALAPMRACELVQRALGPRLLAIFIDRGEILERVDCRVRHIAIDLTLRIGDARGTGRLLLPAPAIETAIVPMDEAIPAEAAPEIASAQIALHPFLGRCVLDARDMAGLQLGDVVMLDGVRCPGTLIGPARLSTATFELHGHFTPAGFTLTRAETRATSLPQEPTVKTKPDAHPPLPVEVEVELTRLRLPISELATLRAGAVLPLRIGANEPVVLRVGDRAVARAELVDIEGEIGARIIGLLK
jgi:type III secretion protein Q